MRPAIPLVIMMVFGLIGLSMAYPLLPYMLKVQGVSEFWQVAIFSLFSLVSFFASPLWGRLSDKIGRKPVMLLTLAGSAGCCLWLYFCVSAHEIYINRACAGLFAGWMAVAQAYIGDWISAENRVRGMAMLGISFGIGFTVGPLLSSLLLGDWQTSTTFFQPPLLSALGFYLAAALILVIYIKDVPPQSKSRPQLSLSHVIAETAITRALLLALCFQLAFTAMEGTLALWVFDSLRQGGPKAVGKLLAVAGLASLLTHAAIVGRLGRHFDEMLLAGSGICLLILALLTLVWAHSETQAYFTMCLAAMGHGLFVSACSGFLSRRAPHGWQGGIMGFFQSGNNLARIAGPSGGGLLYTLLGNRWTYVVLLVPLLPALILALHLHRHKHRR